MDIDRKIRETFEKAQAIHNELVTLKRLFNPNNKDIYSVFFLRKNII